MRRRLITFRGRTMSIKEWAEHLGMPYPRLQLRLYHGWSVEDALTAPCGRNRREITFEGRTQSLQDWANEYGVSYQAAYNRIYKRGWPIKDALTTPMGTYHRGGDSVDDEG